MVRNEKGAKLILIMVFGFVIAGQAMPAFWSTE